ncbi:MAG: hypothetical protein ACR2N2_11975 [Acidimicrobiia bacterium]
METRVAHNELLQRSGNSSLTRRIDVGDEETTLETIVKSRVIKLALTLGTLATALLAGAASLRVG